MNSAVEIIRVVSIVLYLLSTGAYISYLTAQRDFWRRSGFYLLAGGFVVHTAALGAAFLEKGHLPVHDMHGTLLTAGWAVAGTFLLFQRRFQLRVLGVIAAPLTSMLVIASQHTPPAAGPPDSLFKSLWLIVHVVAVFAGDAVLALACGVGIFYLLQEYAIKRKRHGFFFKRLPSLQLLDATGYACIVVGFTLLTVGLITGFVYAQLVWGRMWSWDPKEIWSGIAWLIYAALLHQRLSAGWRGRRSAIMAIVGFAVLVFTFLGVNFLLPGHHKPFTQW